MASLFSASLRSSASSSRWSALPTRSFSTTRPALSTKVPIALVAELRRRSPVSLSKAREALSASDNDISRALEWLSADLEVAGAAKAAKVGAREANEGLIGVRVMGTRAAMVEIRSETDFVGRNEVFRKLVESVAGTVAFLDPPEPAASGVNANDPLVASPVDELLGAPLVSADPAAAQLQGGQPLQTISQAITAAITQTGENIVFARAVSFAAALPIEGASSSAARQPLLVPGAYVHGAASAGANEGRVGALVVLEVDIDGTPADATDSAIAKRIASDDSLGADIQKLARTLARQAVGFPTAAIEAPTGTQVAEEDAPRYLLEQPGMMFGGGEERAVREVLKAWGAERNLVVKVKAVKRWSVGGQEE